jgi:hypothetical protein
VSAPPAAAPSPTPWLSTRAILRVVITVLVCVLALYLVYLLRRPITWIFIAGFIAIALSGPVSFLQRRMRRGAAVALVYLGLILVPVLIMSALIPPVVTQGAVVFHNAQIADAGMKEVNATAAKCPSAWTISGGPPEIIGSYTVNTRPLELDGWKGFSQQLAHTAPRDVNPDTYDDLATVVLHKGNAILYAGFAQIKNTGERADSGAKAAQVMDKALARLK